MSASPSAVRPRALNATVAQRPIPTDVSIHADSAVNGVCAHLSVSIQESKWRETFKIYDLCQIYKLPDVTCKQILERCFQMGFFKSKL